MQITKGWADCKPILVAVAAEDHNTANASPIANRSIPFDLSDFNIISLSVTRYSLIPGMGRLLSYPVMVNRAQK